jgi:CHASE3 domain sensor protein
MKGLWMKFGKKLTFGFGVCLTALVLHGGFGLYTLQQITDKSNNKKVPIIDHDRQRHEG